MSLPDRAGLVPVLDAFGLGEAALLGRGGEANVFALDAERVLRVHHAGTDAASVSGRTSLLSELNRSAAAVPFAIPDVLETRRVAGRIVTIERRLPGRPLTKVLGESAGEPRARLVRVYLEATGQIAGLAVDRPWYGDLCQAQPIRTRTFRDYLRKRAAHSLKLAGAAFASIDPAELAAGLPEPDAPAFVHLDAFAGNMLTDDGRITSVLDFGGVPIVGDRRLDPLAAAAYLDAEITPTSSDADRAVAGEWLTDRGLHGLYGPARRWLAAFWSAATDDPRLQRWSGAILGV